MMARRVCNNTLQHLHCLDINSPLAIRNKFSRQWLFGRKLRMKSTKPESNSLNLLILVVTLICIILTLIRMSIAILDFFATGELVALLIETLLSVIIMSTPFCLYVLAFHWTRLNNLARGKRLYTTLKKCWLTSLYLCSIPFFNYYLITLTAGHR